MRGFAGMISLDPTIVIGQDPDGQTVCAVADLPAQPADVGIMLADVIRTIADAYADTLVAADAPDRADVVEAARMEVWQYLQAEIKRPTAELSLTAGRLAPERLRAVEEPEAGS